MNELPNLVNTILNALILVAVTVGGIFLRRILSDIDDLKNLYDRTTKLEVKMGVLWGDDTGPNFGHPYPLRKRRVADREIGGGE